MSSLTQSTYWQQLASLSETIKSQHMRDWFLADPSRASIILCQPAGLS
jgi:glucose-6-phosphate isomerase